MPEKAYFTEEQKAKLAEPAHKNEERIRSVKDVMSQTFWELGDALLENKDLGYWQVNHETWKSFLASPEIDIQSSTARRLIRLLIVRKSLEAQKADADWEGLSETKLTRHWLPCVKVDMKYRVVKNKDEAIELLNALKTLSLTDFKNMIHDKKVEQTPDEDKVAPKIQEGPVWVNGVMAGYVKRIKADKEYHYFSMKIENEFVQLPFQIEVKS